MGSDVEDLVSSGVALLEGLDLRDECQPEVVESVAGRVVLTDSDLAFRIELAPAVDLFVEVGVFLVALGDVAREEDPAIDGGIGVAIFVGLQRLTLGVMEAPRVGLSISRGIACDDLRGLAVGVELDPDIDLAVVVLVPFLLCERGFSGVVVPGIDATVEVVVEFDACEAPELVDLDPL